MITEHTFDNGYRVFFSRGNFDGWCVYEQPKGKPRKAPTDVSYFTTMQEFAEKYGADNIYKKFVEIYDITTSQVEEVVLSQIAEVSSDLDGEHDQFVFAKTMCIIYFAMVAEENKQFSKLHRRIKRLGIHQVLVDEYSPELAAEYSRGLKWRQIAKECEDRGF
jgi:hypothetical protein